MAKIKIKRLGLNQVKTLLSTTTYERKRIRKADTTVTQHQDGKAHREIFSKRR